MSIHCYNCQDIFFSNHSWYFAWDHIFCSNNCRYLFIQNLDNKNIKVKKRPDYNQLSKIIEIKPTISYCPLLPKKVGKIKPYLPFAMLNKTKIPICYSIITTIFSSLALLTSVNKFSIY